jgi:hypothetical protein
MDSSTPIAIATADIGETAFAGSNTTSANVPVDAGNAAGAATTTPPETGTTLGSKTQQSTVLVLVILLVLAMLLVGIAIFHRRRGHTSSNILVSPAIPTMNAVYAPPSRTNQSSRNTRVRADTQNYLVPNGMSVSAAHKEGATVDEYEYATNQVVAVSYTPDVGGNHSNGEEHMYVEPNKFNLTVDATNGPAALPVAHASTAGYVNLKTLQTTNQDTYMNGDEPAHTTRDEFDQFEQPTYENAKAVSRHGAAPAPAPPLLSVTSQNFIVPTEAGLRSVGASATAAAATLSVTSQNFIVPTEAGLQRGGAGDTTTRTTTVGSTALDKSVRQNNTDPVYMNEINSASGGLYTNEINSASSGLYANEQSTDAIYANSVGRLDRSGSFC